MRGVGHEEQQHSGYIIFMWPCKSSADQTLINEHWIELKIGSVFNEPKVWYFGGLTVLGDMLTIPWAVHFHQPLL